LALPLRRKLSISALLIGAALPDIESLFYAVQAFGSCATAQCVADWPSHFILHSFLGLLLIVAPLATIAALWLRDKKFNHWRSGLPMLYASALLGGLLHLIPDLAMHVGADALHLLWPAAQTFEFNFFGAGLIWDALALFGAAAFIWNERGKVLK
jgi:membrane-bound metal-dependent hydrolase YbcI (DUF457 family)